ncbi:MAG: bifunctional DNA-formamidopyrimidine glycosylase/DNA-(apurinic or apyrimidinic site) lyase [Zetaproteobacteria bacterium]|nr:MAG: bifunctional DNA-formamidopyrimidine glycosylase/DNA-(apurinic or apyrimidinic site) lyase [Zetaproteobacteria bacterium]
MPELPEVEVTRRGLMPHVFGRHILHARDHGQALRYPYPDWRILQGRKILDIQRRAKYLLFCLEGDGRLVCHLGMTGQFRCLPSNEEVAQHEQVCLHLDDGWSLRYCDVRRFGYMAFISESAFSSHPWFSHLGPEPLSDAFTPSWLIRCCRGRRCSIKHLVMDTRIVVGVGNIYASEALFRSGIHPARKAGDVGSEALIRLHAALREVLAEAIRAGGSTIRDFRRSDGRPGYFSHAFRVYGREGEPCVECGGVIQRFKQDGRSSFFCPSCQT